MRPLTHHTSEAERMNELLTQLTEMWCCLVCYAKFEAGDLTTHSFNCPHCNSQYIHPIHRGTIELDHYNGPIGSRN
jgi:rubrerythrin